MIHDHVSTELAAALPREVVEALGLLPGEAIDYVIEGDSVRISRSAEEEIDLGLTTEQLRQLVQEGLEGPTLPGEAVLARVRRRLEERRIAGAA